MPSPDSKIIFGRKKGLFAPAAVVLHLRMRKNSQSFSLCASDERKRQFSWINFGCIVVKDRARRIQGKLSAKCTPFEQLDVEIVLLPGFAFTPHHLGIFATARQIQALSSSEITRVIESLDRFTNRIDRLNSSSIRSDC